MSSLKELVAKQKEKVAVPVTGRAVVLLGGVEVTLELTKLPPKQWLDLSAVHPPRIRSSSDTTLGFNPHSLAEAYPVDSVRRVEADDSLSEISAEDYAAMFEVLDAIHIDTIGTVIWAINVWQDRMAVADARKASRAGRSKKRSSPES